MIEMLNVSKKYNNGITAVNNLSVKIEQGEFVYIVGPSGAGKSTFVKMMYREVKPSSGTVQVGKYNLTTMKEKEIPLLRRFVGVVFQDFKLLPKLTVYENI
ncbi:MAG TPA: ATP-binding cassette domain-containing protein, partial [Trichococcus flocculiformis]|nr:ATP-binding cassette domain-containing protein [Trichococcus flocculiformis]